MDIYLIRHAEAVPKDDLGPATDADRPLMEAGFEQARLVAATLQAHGAVPDVLATSPLLRARQTAETMLHAWSAPADELHTCAALKPGTKPRKVAKFLVGLRGPKSVGLVGHQPDIGELAGWLIGSRKARIDIAKAGVALIVCDDVPAKGCGRLTWVLTPEWCRANEPATA